MAEKQGAKNAGGFLGLVESSSCEQVSYIENILVINSNGLCLASANPTTCDPNLLAGLLAALQNIGAEIMGSDIECVSFKEHRLHFIKEGELLFVTQTSRTLPEDIVFELLAKTSRKFLKKYKSILNRWSGSLELFEGAEKVLKKWLNRLNRLLNDYMSQPQAADVHPFDSKDNSNSLASQSYDEWRKQIGIVPN
ncbi:MAG: hypothetical protein KIH08_08100 [Candidatus Freyarchaeota archaeon]|nr:hypothetical protein [Candidatus Jordarchaeia archaeon]MBS7270617.1 hypothetical protein [Candidatus Jordarchaeia archaeon]MBS7281444.1 hypothetical protein [Candidatus Jordarchaeia archaeon]